MVIFVKFCVTSENKTRTSIFIFFFSIFNLCVSKFPFNMIEVFNTLSFVE